MNSFFKFKQFTIQQDKCAMKVCTDACLFGAYVAAEIKNENNEHILDIGAGTGLISLMLAQELNTSIITVEINEDAYKQATQNIECSKFNNKIKVLHTDVLRFKPKTKFDFIISNPPFFENDLKSDNKNKNSAKHDDTLTLEQLISCMKILLVDEGKFALLIPYSRLKDVETILLNKGFSINKLIKIKQSINHSFFRIIVFCSKQNHQKNEEEIFIKDSVNNYSPKFIELLKDYYLYL